MQDLVSAELTMKAWEATVRRTHAAAKKRAHTIFGTSSCGVEEDTADQEEEIHSSGEVYQAEKHFLNGDYYTGYWADGVPHGQGKYCWVDGCMYVGEWFKGKPTGRGLFSWQSGAMYDGNFKSGFLDGEGTYIGANGEQYKGYWVMNMMHGHGVKDCENGDCYDGQWCRGSQEGEGRYQWKNGVYYVGEWNGGQMCGVGKMIWPNENVYEGNWEEGLPKGNGKFKWPNGSCYVGNWSRNPEEQDGTYYPAESPTEGNNEFDQQEIYNEMSEIRVSSMENIPVWPSQKKLAVRRSGGSPDGSFQQRRLSIDGRIDSGGDKDLGGRRMSDAAASSLSACSSLVDGDDPFPALHSEHGSIKCSPIRIPKTVKRQGETISKGHRNYDLMLNLQLGIRHSVAKPGPPPSVDLKPSAFDPKEKYWTKFPSEGSKYTPPHQSCEFKWKDYCPKVFRSLRMLFKVDPASYMLSICGDEALRELSSPGKSGSFFYLTNDDRYMIKTMKKAEVKVILRMLSAYYNHVRSFENTLVTKYFGLHCVKINGQKVRFVIMGNLFCTEYTIHRRYDLKGSTFGRVTDKPESEIDATTTLKDLDLNFIFKLQKTWFQEFRRQVDKDCELLEQERVMDYSLLVGLHFTESANGVAIPCGAAMDIDNGSDSSTGRGSSGSGSDAESVPRSSTTEVDQLLFDPSAWESIKLGISMPTRVERMLRSTGDAEIQLVGEPTGEYYNVILFFGIIDILQDYDITKKLEHAYKSIQCDPNSISAVDPRMYSRRFRDYIFKVFEEDT